MTEEIREKPNTEMPEGGPDGDASAEVRKSVTAAETPAEVTQAVSRKKSRTKKGLLIALGACAILLVAGIAFVNHYLGKIRRIDPESQSVLSPSEAEDILATMTDEYDPDLYIRIDDTTKAAEQPEQPEQPEETTKTGTVWQRGKKETVQETVDPRIGREFVIHTKETEPEIDWEWKEAPPLDDKDRINIMLIGQDTRDITFRQFSDTMILVSVNPSTHDIAIVSFVRDLYVPIHEGYQDNRLNTPYYIGGTTYLKECLEKNFGLHIDGFVIINFGVFRKIVDVLGGIDITLTQYEAECAQDVLNRSYLDMVYWDEAMRELDISLFGSSEESTEETTEATTEEPTTAEPTTEEPTTAEPTTAEPTTEEPTTEEPTTEEPTTEEPTTEEPTTEEPTTEETAEGTEASSETEGGNETEPETTFAAEVSGEAMTGSEEEGESTGESMSESGNETNSAARSLEGLLAREDAGSRVVSGSDRIAASPILLKSSKKTKSTTAESTEETTEEEEEEDPTPNFHAGWNHLNGNEALAYVRMRNLESDLNRTARQRRFMDIIFGKMKELEPAQLFEMLDAILPYITTDLTDLQIINYASRIVPYLKQSAFTTNRIPADDTYRYVFIRDMSVVQAVQQPNLDALAEWLSH